VRIGPHLVEPAIIMAPMAGVSETPFRVIALDAGAGMAPTELISAKGLELASARTEAYLRRDVEREKPFVVQLFGGDPDVMGRAAEIAVARGADILDINMGCPVKKIVKGGAGSALMLDIPRAQAIVRAMRARGGVPVTAKIRAGWDEKSVNAVEMARALEDAGIAMLTLHARTRAQGYSGRSDWSLIRRVKSALTIPVVANGDINTTADADRVRAETGCDAIMIGRAALGNPWIFRALRSGAEGEVSSAERGALISAHFRAHVEHTGDALRAVHKFRQHLIWYSRGLEGGASFRARALLLDDLSETRDAIDAYFCAARQIDASEAAIYDERTALG